MSALRQHLEASTSSRPSFGHLLDGPPFRRVDTASAGLIAGEVATQVEMAVISSRTTLVRLTRAKPILHVKFVE